LASLNPKDAAARVVNAVKTGGHVAAYFLIPSSLLGYFADEGTLGM